MAECGPASKAGFAGDIENEDLDAPNCVEAVTEAHISFAEEIGQDEVFEPRGWCNNLRTWKGGKCEKRNLKTQPDPSDDISEFSNSQSSSSWRGKESRLGCLEQGWAQMRHKWARVSTRICGPGPKNTTDLCSARTVTGLQVVLFFRGTKHFSC